MKYTKKERNEQIGKNYDDIFVGDSKHKSRCESKTCEGDQGDRETADEEKID